MSAPSEFTTKVISTIQKIPAGQVATYKQIAALAGKPHGSRGVAWILHSCSKSHKLPWQRVLNAQGKISFPPGSAHFKRQRTLLQKEGVVFAENGKIDMTKFQWKKKPAVKKNRPKIFS